jgi:putative transcriptional regulator
VSKKLIESLRGDLAALKKAGAISKVTVREFDAICPPAARESSAADTRRLSKRRRR